MAGWITALANALNAAKTTAQNGGSKEQAQQAARDSFKQQMVPSAPAASAWQSVTGSALPGLAQSAYATQAQEGQGSGGQKQPEAPEKQEKKKYEDEESSAPKANGDEQAPGLFNIAMQSALRDNDLEDLGDGFSGSGGKFNVTFDEAMEAGLGSDAYKQYWKEQASDMGGSVGMANPVGAGIKGMLAGIKAAKAEKAIDKAVKLEEKANKAAQKAGIAENAATAGKAGKAAETAAEEAEPMLSRSEKAIKEAEEKGTKKAMKEAKKVGRQEAKREKMLTDENGYFGNVAKEATKDIKVTQPKDLMVPGLAGLGLLGTAGVTAAVNPDFMERPLGEALANQASDVLKETGWDTGPIGAQGNPTGPLKVEATGDLADEESKSPLANPENPEQTYYGLTANDLMTMYEDAIYDAAMKDKDYSQAFKDAGYWDKYGLDAGGYAAYGSLNDDELDYKNSRRDITRDIFGLNEGENPLEIQGLKQIYKENGTINDKMTNEEMLDAILNYHWDEDHVIDPIQWLDNAEYEKAHPFAGDTAGKSYADYWISNGYIPVPENQATLFSGLEGGLSTLDNADLAMMINAGNIANQIENGVSFNPSKIGELLKGAGDQSDFDWLPVGSSEDERGYKGHDWNLNGRNYSAQAIGEALGAANTGGGYQNLSAYEPYGIDADMADYLMGLIQQYDRQGRSIGRKTS